MSAVVGFRYGGGVDYFSYVEIFNSVGIDWYADEKVEKGFLFLNWLVKELGGTAEAIIFTSFLISIFLILLTIRKYSPYPGLSIVVLFGSELLFILTNTIRQGIAISICFFAVRFIIERKFFWFILSVSIASLFHLSAFVYIPFYFLASYKYSKSFLFAVFTLSLFCILDNNIAIEAIALTDRFIFGGRYFPLLVRALEEGRPLGFRLLLFSMFLILMIAFYPKLTPTQDRLVIVNFCIVGFLLFNVFSGLPAVYRLTHYYTFFSFIAIPLFITLFTRHVDKVLAYSCLLITYAFLFLRVLLYDGQQVLPYRSILF